MSIFNDKTIHGSRGPVRVNFFFVGVRCFVSRESVSTGVSIFGNFTGYVLPENVRHFLPVRFGGGGRNDDPPPPPPSLFMVFRSLGDSNADAFRYDRF